MSISRFIPRVRATHAFAITISLAFLAGAQTFPAKEWTNADSPESVGFSKKRLDSLTPLLGGLDTSAMLVVSKGKVVYSYGDLSKLSYLASCRKSVLAMLYGNYVASGKIQLNKTLRDLNMDDVGGLLPSELDATIENLISARSGVFHPASYPGDAQDSAPPPRIASTARGKRKRATRSDPSIRPTRCIFPRAIWLASAT